MLFTRIVFPPNISKNASAAPDPGGTPQFST
jgi:hypothetical protein